MKEASRKEASLRLDLRVLRRGESRVERSYAAERFPAARGDDYVVARPLRLALAVHRDGQSFRLRGGLETTVELGCSRCLARYPVALDLDVDVRYLPQDANTGEGELEIADSDLGTAFYRDDELDLERLIREQLQLAAPMKPLCRVDCRGLCPVCGVDRNVDECECDTAWRDPRLEALRAFRPADGGRAGDQGTPPVKSGSDGT